MFEDNGTSNKKPLRRVVECYRMFLARSRYSSLKISNLVGYLDATDREPVLRTTVVHVDMTVTEGAVVGVVADGSRRPIDAAAASKAGVAVVVVTAAGSRKKYARSRS